jgi:ATP-binding cassette subfamily C (CFTR/MRP) protein 4
MFIFLSVSSFAAVIVQDRAWLTIDPGILGLALSLLIQLAGLFQWCIRQVGHISFSLF